MMTCQEHTVLGTVAYVAYVDGNNIVHRVELKRCDHCGETAWVEVGTEPARAGVSDADLLGKDVTAP